MNQIQEKDWAEESWHGHTGIDSSCDYCIVAGEIGEMPKDESGATTHEKGANRVLRKSSQSTRSVSQS
jgi:hypothetical protein